MGPTPDTGHIQFTSRFASMAHSSKKKHDRIHSDIDGPNRQPYFGLVRAERPFRRVGSIFGL